mgnify:CR=1 FL=1
MASSGNFFLWNRLVKGTENVSSGNCKLTLSTNNRGALGNFEIPLTGKWYFEGYIKMASALEGVIGVSDAEVDLQSSRGGKNDGNTEALNFSQYSGSNYYAIKIDGGSEDAGGKIDLGTTDNAVIGVAVNRDDNELKLYANNTLRFTLTLSATTKYFPWCGVGGGTNSSTFVYLNAGADSSFGGNKTAGGNSDGNGFGDFFYSPPTNHLALCSANLPISDDIDPAQTDDDYPSKQFGVVTYTGNGSTQSITGLGFQPDMVWIKSRSSGEDPSIYDSSRGVTKRLKSSEGEAESTVAAGFTAFGSDGFSLGSATENNDSGETFVAWCWKANGGTTTSFTASGDRLAGNHQANTKSKFSIITYTGSGSADAEVLHGLGATPNFIIAKDRGATYWWNVYLKSGGTVYTGYDSLLYLNSNNAVASGQAVNIVPDSTKIVFSGNEQINKSSNTYVMYAWADVDGMQKFGTFEGNQNANGPFIYTGFRPKMIFMKNLDTGSTEWAVSDSARDTSNPIGPQLNWDNSNVEGADKDVDFLSQGFKIRKYTGAMNDSGTMIYGAWGDVPFKYNNTF